LKQLSKPAANYIKRIAKSKVFFRKYICMPPAQLYNRYEFNHRLKTLGLQKAKNIEPLSEKDAIELGGEILGEVLVFTFGATILIWEYSRSAKKEQAKEEKAKSDFRRLNDKVAELTTICGIQKAQIFNLQTDMETLLKKSKEMKK